MKVFRVSGGVGFEVKAVDLAPVFARDPGAHVSVVDVVCCSIVYGVTICEI